MPTAGTVATMPSAQRINRKVLRTWLLRAGRSVFRLAPLERALLSQTVGRAFVGPVSKLPPLWMHYPPDSWRSVSRHGLRYELDLSHIGDWYLYWGFTESSHEALLSLCRPGMTVIDVGANIGLTATRAATVVGRTGRVAAIEPHYPNYLRLVEHATRNGLSWITCDNLALADTHRALNLAPMSPNNSTMQVADFGVHAQAITLDQFVETRGLSPDLVKIDCEGFEARILQGADHTLALRPTLFLEVWDRGLRGHGSSAEDLISFVRARGYTVFDARTGGPVADLQQTDIVCIPN